MTNYRSHISEDNARTPNINNRNINVGSQTPEVLTNPVFTPAYLSQHIGKLVRVEFLIGTGFLNDRVGILTEVGASYIVLTLIESNNLLYCDIYSIKFVTISNTPISNSNQNFDFLL